MSVAEDIAKAQRETARLAALLGLFPDIQKRTGRWGKVAYFSKAVNAQVTGFDARHNCGCCADSPLEIWPFVETAHGPVYSDPPCFTVGERVPWYEDEETRSDRPYDGWDRKMREAGIPERIIESVGVGHFGMPRPQSGEERNGQ